MAELSLSNLVDLVKFVDLTKSVSLSENFADCVDVVISFKSLMFEELTDRQVEVLHYWTKGLHASDIAIALGISLPTIKEHLSEIKNRLSLTDSKDVRLLCNTRFELLKILCLAIKVSTFELESSQLTLSSLASKLIDNFPELSPYQLSLLLYFCFGRKSSFIAYELNTTKAEIHKQLEECKVNLKSNNDFALKLLFFNRMEACHFSLLHRLVKG